jgi:transcription initiation factor TFIID subunit 2
MLLRGSEEAPPKPKIYLPPPTPVVEQPPTLAIKVAKREKTRSDSIMSSPLTPSTSGTKLKLSFNAGGTPSQSAAKPLPTPVRATPKPVVPVRTPTPAVITKPSLKPHKLSTRQVPKSQSGGMASTEYKAAKKLLGELVRHKNAPLFLQPVDPIRDKVPK